MENGSTKSYNLKSSYVDRDESGEMRKFQSELIEFVRNGTERVAILDTPTGSGKTYSFKKIGSQDMKTVIVLPNNLLAKEASKDFGENSAVLNKESITEYNKKRTKKYSIQRTTLSETIMEIINEKTHIITNPTVFYYLLLNHYNQGEKEDMITILVKNNIKTVIFDEFHIYSKDQISMITACAMLIPKNIKIIFSSATPQDYFKEFSQNVFGTDEVKYISVQRFYDGNEKRDILQGPISLNIIFQNTQEFVKDNIELFKDGHWVFILDSIRNVDSVGKILSDYYPEESIAFISAYYDSSYTNYYKIKNDQKDYRIIISTNIIEQGININKKYKNFLIESGQSANNLIQRLGRVGRGCVENSLVYVSLSSGFRTPDESVETIEDAYNLFKKMNYGKSSPIPKPFGVGVYIGLLLEKLTPLANGIILKNLRDYKNEAILAGLYSIINVEETFSNNDGLKKIRKNCFHEIIEIKEWFENYKSTIYSFIAVESKKIKVTDYELEDNFLKTEYGYTWIKKNKKILGVSVDGIIVGQFNSKPNYDFDVRVSNLPEGERRMRYPDIAFQAKKVIMEELEKLLEEIYCEENEKMQVLKKNILSIVRETAGVERVKMEVIDEE